MIQTSILVISAFLAVISFHSASADDNSRPYGYMMGPGNMMGYGQMGPGNMGMGYGRMYPGHMMGGMMGPGHMMGGAGMGMGGMMGPGNMMGMGYMNMLDLTDSQRKSMRDIHKSMRNQMIALHDNVGEYSDELYTLYREEKPNAKKIGAVYKKIFDIKRQKIELKISTHNKVHDVLTKEQKEKLKQWNMPGMGTPPIGRTGMPGRGMHMMQ